MQNITSDGGEIGTQELGEPFPVTPVVEVDGEFIEVPEEAVPEAQTGDVVDVTVESNADLPVDQALELASGGDGSQAGVVSVDATGQNGTTSQSALAAGFSSNTLTVVPVYWTTPSHSTANLRTLADTSAAYWEGQTAGGVDIASINVANWIAVAAPASCSVSDMMALHNTARVAAGVPASTSTNHVVLFFPQWTACAFAGMASVGGGMIWINGTLTPDVWSHEFGHNLGLGHANTLTCVLGSARVMINSPISSCTSREYGDYADVMGIGMAGRPTGNLNTSLADSLGMVVGSDAVTLTASTASATVGLQPLANVTGFRTVRIPTGDGTVYVDYRPAVGQDTRWGSWAGVQVHLRTVDARGVATSYLLNMHPAAGDFISPALTVGQSWPIPGTTITVGVAAAGATAQVNVLAGAMNYDLVESYITRVYTDLFGRGVDPTGLATWGNALRSGTPRVAVANAITASVEYRSRLINESYRAYLDRGPDPAGLANWLAAMYSGVTIQQMESGFLASAEYYARSGFDNSTWVRSLYQDVLHRAPGASEVDSWVAELRAGRTRAYVALGFLMSTEHLTAVVDGYYVNLLGRHIDPCGQATWVSAIQSGSRVEEIIGSIIASEEYYYY